MEIPFASVEATRLPALNYAQVSFLSQNLMFPVLLPHLQYICITFTLYKLLSFSCNCTVSL